MPLLEKNKYIYGHFSRVSVLSYRLICQTLSLLGLHLFIAWKWAQFSCPSFSPFYRLSYGSSCVFPTYSVLLWWYFFQMCCNHQSSSFCVAFLTAEPLCLPHHPATMQSSAVSYPRVSIGRLKCGQSKLRRAIKHTLDFIDLVNNKKVIYLITSFYKECTSKW